MKKLLLACVMVCSALTASAQEETTSPTDKGHFIVDGSVFFAINNSETDQDGFNTKNKSFGVGISPKAAYFVIDRLAVGLETSFNYFDSEFTNSQGEKTSSNGTGISVGPFARYYLANGLFGEGSVRIGTSTTKSEGEKYTSDSFRYRLGIGYAIFLGPQVSLEPIISYSHTKNTNNRSTAENTSSGFTLGAGFTIYL
jgi:opacity protein-like surface antigen